MMKNLVNAMATAIVAAAEQMGPKPIEITRYAGTKDEKRIKMFKLAEVAHTMSKKQFHDMVLSSFLGFRKRNSFLEVENLGDKEINSMYDDLISRDDDCTTIGFGVSHWEWEYDGVNYTGNLQMSFVPANGGIVCRFEISLYDPFKEESKDFRHWTEMANYLYKLHEHVQEVKEWLRLHEVKVEAPAPAPAPKTDWEAMLDK